MCTDNTRSNCKTHKNDPSLMNAFQKQTFKLLVGTQRTEIPIWNNTEAGKRISTTESLLLLKSQTIFQSKTIRRYISIRPTKNDLFVPSITNDNALANNIRIASIRYARKFPTAVKTSSARFNELLDFSGSSLQATYGHLLIQASYRQFDQFSNSSQTDLVSFNERLKCYSQFSNFCSTDYSTVELACAAKLTQYSFWEKESQFSDATSRTNLHSLQIIVVLKQSSGHKRFYPPRFKHPPQLATARVFGDNPP